MANKSGNLQNKIRKRTGSPKGSPKKKKESQDRFIWILIIVGLFLVFQWIFSSLEQTSQEMTY
ncbi:MAG: hypothetical protein DRP85_00625, partial [Candidatus Makaraimicrobium thalassicum]